MKDKNLICLARCVAVAAVAGASGCATAASTTNMLAAQTEQSRGLLRLEQANTRQLSAQKASLQGRLAGLTERRNQLTASGGSGSSDELRKINAEIAQLKGMIANQ